jgi:molybdopterin molybdotransferase
MVVDFEQALGIVRAATRNCALPATERASLLESLGRILAQPIVADRDHPAFDRSARDGYAVQAAALMHSSLKILGLVRAGEIWTGDPVGINQAVQIMTGAPLPAGADAVAMVEHVSAIDGAIALSAGRTLSAGENVVPRASEAHAADAVVASSTRIGAAEIALAAACGCASLNVYARPTVAIVATGDELVEVDVPPAPQQIRNSNSYALAALVTLAGGNPLRLPIAPDTREQIRDRIERGCQADLLVLSGGVSMGEYDLVEEALAELGAEFLFTGVTMQPGRPVVFGRVRGRYFFGLPGNPISTQVTFHCFVEPIVRALAGDSACQPRWAHATLAEDVSAKPGLTRLLPARMDGIQARLVGWQGSGDLAANARANCYLELLPGRSYTPGEVLRVLLR